MITKKFISLLLLFFINVSFVYSENEHEDKVVEKNSMKTAICAIAKMENNYINDWCRYHINLGFDDIYIFDNNDEDYEPIESRIDKDILPRIHITKVPGIQKDFQRASYNTFINENYYNYDWYGFIDIDEFFVVKKFKTIKEFLSQKAFEKAEQIKFEWHIYGDNDEIKQDISIPIYERIVKEVFPKYRGGHLCKPILKGKKKLKFVTHHYAKNLDGTSCNDVNIYGQYLNNTGFYVDKRYEDSYIAHYMTKTLDEFINQKFRRIEHNSDHPADLMSQQDPYKRFKYFFNVNKPTSIKFEYIKEKLNVDFIEKENGVYKLYEPAIIYWSGTPNAGDQFAEYIADKLKINKRGSIAIMGNILSSDLIKYAKYIWGCSATNGRDPLLKDPKRYYAVGGKKTLDILKKYGDVSKIVTCNPGLLASFLYKPQVQKKYKLCIISHWQDYDLLKDYASSEVNVIDTKTKDIESVLDKINECSFTVSTSLHGIVFSHSYGIKSIKLNFERGTYKSIFKYEDYYSSIDKEFRQLNSEEDLRKIIHSDEILKEVKESISIPSSLEIVKKQLEYLSVSPPVQNIFSNMKNIIGTFLKKKDSKIEPEKINEWITKQMNNGYSDIFIFNINESLKNIENTIDQKIKDKVHIFNILNESDDIQNEVESSFKKYMNRYYKNATFTDI